MRCLILSSVLLLGFVVLCKKTQAFPSRPLFDVTQFFPRFESAKYRAAIDVTGKHLSGILIFKTQEDSSIRSVFINEMGLTFFDIVFYINRYLFVSAINSLNKKPVKLALAKDIGMILMRGIYDYDKGNISGSPDELKSTLNLKLKRKGSVNYHLSKTVSEPHHITLIENYGKRKKIITISQFYTPKNSIPDSIFVQHHNVNFTISLKLMHAAE